MKEEGWWLVLGDVDTHELLALKRISFRDLTTTRLTFPLSNGAGKTISEVTLFFVSDSYQGLDQQYTVPVRMPAQRDVQHQGKQHQGTRDARTAGTSSQQAAVPSGATAESENASSDEAGTAQTVPREAVQSATEEIKDQRANVRRRRG